MSLSLYLDGLQFYSVLQLAAVVSFLCQVPDPHGQPALNFVLQEWTSQHVSHVMPVVTSSLVM